MHTLKIEHAIIDFDTWKAAFESDPAGRQRSGVRRYRISRPVDDPKYVMIDLDFDSAAEAHAFLERMRQVWSRIDLSPGLLGAERGTKTGPQTTVVEVVESKEY